MPTYSITAPNGKKLDVTGDHVPTEAELHQIFSAAGVETGAAASAPAGIQSWDTGKFLEGAWKNLNPITAAEGLYGAVRHPIDTASNIGTAQLAQLSKAVADAKAGRLSEAVGHGAAGLIPIVGPAAAAAGERIGAGDVSGGLGEAAGLLAPFTAGPLMRGANAGTQAAINAARGTETGATALDSLAAVADRASTNRLVDVAAPKVGPNKVKLTNKLAEAAPKLTRAEDLSALSREGLAVKVAAKLDDATAALDDAHDARLASQQVKTQPILAQIDGEIAKLTAAPVEGSRSIPTVTSPGVSTMPLPSDGLSAARRAELQQKLGGVGSSPELPPQTVEARPIGQAVEPAPSAAQIDTLRKIRSEVAQLGPVAPYESIRRIRAAWDQVAKAKFLPSTAEDALKSQGAANGALRGTAALREGLSIADPATAAANADFSLYKTANDVLQAAIESERARPKVLRGVLSRSMGAMAGADAAGIQGAGAGAMLGALVERADSLAPTMKIVMARKLASVADMLRGGNAEGAQATLKRLTLSLPSKTQMVKEAAVPLGRVVDFASGLPMAADSQGDSRPTTAQR